MNKSKNIARLHWQEEEALRRFQMISPLMDEQLDHAKRVQLRQSIADKEGISYKTVKRYDDAFRGGGFEALKPRDREPRGLDKLPANFGDLLQEAIQLRREVPSRSVDKIITILELEGRVEPGILKRSTLQRHMHEAGFGKEHLYTYQEARKSSSRRFCKPHRMMLLQGDYPDVLVIPMFPQSSQMAVGFS